MEDDPINFHQAVESSNSQKWIDVMNEEMKSINNNDVWELVPLPKLWNPLVANGYLRPSGIRKAMWRGIRLVLSQRASHKKKGINYKENFSLIFLKDSFRTILALMAHFDLELHQIDVETVFLNNDIDERIYMVQQENFVSRDPKNMVSKHKKSIYGLKQVSR